MRKPVTWLLSTIGIVALGLAVYVAKINHDLSAGLRRDFNRRFTAAAAQAIPLGESHNSTEDDRIRIGQAVIAEYMIGARVVSYHANRGVIPSSVEEIDSSGQPSAPDPWGQPFQLVHDSGGRFLVICGGPAHAALTNEEKDFIMRQHSGQVYLVDGKVVLSGKVL